MFSDIIYYAWVYDDPLIYYNTFFIYLYDNMQFM